MDLKDPAHSEDVTKKRIQASYNCLSPVIRVSGCARLKLFNAYKYVFKIDKSLMLIPGNSKRVRRQPQRPHQKN